MIQVIRMRCQVEVMLFFANLYIAPVQAWMYFAHIWRYVALFIKIGVHIVNSEKISEIGDGSESVSISLLKNQSYPIK